jgi:hypothetical protein
MMEKTEALNKDQQEKNWFTLVAFEPVITLFRIEFIQLFIFSLTLGAFLAFWAVLIRHYLK